MEKDYLISVIVPVYNTYEYLKKCLDSVCVQCCDQIQVVIVDDGSTDGSEQICDEYANQNNDVLVIHEENKGVVHARKVGVEASSGKYLAFIDSDDWIDFDFFSSVFDYMLNRTIDIIAFNCVKEYKDKSIVWSNLIDAGEYSFEELDGIKKASIIDSESFVPWMIMPHLCTKIISRKLIEKYMYNVDDRINFGEDAASFYPCLWNANKIMVLDKAPYHYVQRTESASNQFFEVASKIIKQISNCLLKSEYMNEEIKKQIFLYEKYLYLLRNYTSLKKYGMTLYPFKQIKENDKIVIYGAGGFGKSLWNYINKTKCVNIQALVDRLGDKCSTEEYQVVGIESVSSINFDYILIAILNEMVAKDIEKELINKGVKKSKILYITRQSLFIMGDV